MTDNYQKMKTIQVIEHNGIYSCDIGISKEEWLAILRAEHFPDDYRITLLKFYYTPSHRGSCTVVGNAYGENAQKLNANIREIGRFVQKYLNRFQVVRPDGSACYWIIPMCEGMDLPKGSEGSFEWELRPELVEAIREYLYWYLVERYKAVRKEIPINDTNWTEIYKWELITASKGKTPFDIVRDSVAHPNKAALGGFENLIDAVRDNKTLKYLVENNPNGLQNALSRLTDESQTLNQRLADYKAVMAAQLPASGFGSKANDERTASVILTCINPQKYTIYKYDVYNMLCKYLGDTKKPTGQCYKHFMELLKPLSDIASQDKELQEIVSLSLAEQDKSDLLLAQDILWILLISFPQQLGYVRSIMLPNKQRVWLWNQNVGVDTDDSLGVGSSAKTIKDFRPYKSKNALRKAYRQDVGNNDLKIPDAYWSFLNEVSVGDIVVLFEPKKGNGRQYHLLHGWGMFTSDCTIVESNENPMRREVEWHYPFLAIPKQNEEMGNSIFFQATTDKQALHIKQLLDIHTNETMESKYQKYIDLLKANHNLILTGAPGTGKTFMAKEIAKEMRCEESEIGFVQFHPSYDYTDFVEGLRPKNDENGNVGFERKDGMFKEFCKEALKNLVDSKKSVQTLQQETSVRDLIEDFVEEAIENETEYKTSGTKNAFHIIENKERSIIVEIPGNEKTKEVSLPKSDLITLLENKVKISGGKDIQTYFKRKYRTQPDSYVYVLYNHLKKISTDTKKVEVSLIPLKNFVFIIDEINRGEISKIFGELFFSIDPGYRGEKGKVQTQYQNMIEEDDVFKDGFYVPENVYIIGTMNDIDRSVESMDFAMRRRFAWQEVTAEESYDNMIAHDADFAAIKDEIKQRMFNLNKAIAVTEGLDENYQIGAAYFRKILDYNGQYSPFDCLWNNHLKGLLAEYLRGNRKAKELLEKLHEASNQTGTDEQSAHTNEG